MDNSPPQSAPIPSGPKPPSLPPRPPVVISSPSSENRRTESSYGKLPTLASAAKPAEKVPVLKPFVQPPSRIIEKPAPKPQVPAAPAIAPVKKETSSPAENKPILIRTMKDDIQQVRTQPKVAPRPQLAPTLTNEGQQVMPTSPVHPPLVPNQENGQSIVIPPRKTFTPKKTGARIRIAVISILLVALLGGAGAWIYFNQDVVDQYLPNQEPKDIAEMIPAHIASVVEYKIESPDAVERITDFWSTQRERQPSMTTLFEGDPRLLLGYEDVKDIYYVFLPEETRPYLLVKKTESTTSLFSQLIEGQVLSQNGWFVIHPVSVEPYSTALAQGALVGTGILQVATSSPYIFYTYVDTGIAQSFAKAILEPKLNIDIQNLSLWSDLQPGVSGAISIRGIFHSTALSASEATGSALLEFVPSSINHGWLGGSFAADVKRIAGNEDIFDPAIIARPDMSQFIDQLNQPYAYYKKTQSTGSEDIGLIITLPESLRNQLQVGDAGIEALLPSVLPFLIDQTQAVPQAFSDGLYNGIPLRYVNVLGPNKALDYALHNGYLLIGTSKDAMFELIDVALQAKPNLLTTNGLHGIGQPEAINPLINYILIGQLIEDNLSNLIPGYKLQNPAPLEVHLQRLDDKSMSIEGSLLLQSTSQLEQL